MMRPRLLITGASGRLGQLLQHHLADAYHLRGVCLNTGSLPGIVKADLSVGGDWARLFDGVDCVLHCAAVGSPSAPWAQVQRHNVDATLNVFAAAARADVRRVVFMSSNWTMAGYRFTQERLVESLPPRPINPYGASKVVGERIGKHYADHSSMSVICLRIGSCVGRSPDDPRLAHAYWMRHKWLSDRDFLQLVERSIAATGVHFAAVNGMSMNAGMRWDLSAARELLGYVPLDGLPQAGVLARAREAGARFDPRRMRNPWLHG